MTEMEPGTPKRIARPRRRRVPATDAVESGGVLETGKAEKEALRPVIEDVFEEIAAARAEFEQSPPTERDMDFEASDVPRGYVGDSAPASGDAGVAGGGEFVGGDDANRRRRRRRGRGRGGNGAADNTGYASQPAPSQNQNYGQNQNQNRPPRSRNNNNNNNNNQPDRRGGQPANQRRPHGDGGGQRGQNSNSQRQPYSEPRGGEPRGGEPRGPEVLTPVQGTLEFHPKGYGFLRDPKAGYVSQDSDPFVSGTLIEKYGLREGVHVTGEFASGGRGQGPRLRSVQTIEGRLPEHYLTVKKFDDLTPINPFQQIRLETGPTPITMRVMDLLCPIGKGQRALLVAPPRSGKTMLLQEIADSVSKNYPDIYLIVLLIDERPEEVTEMRRRVNGEVVASSLDREVENHVRVSQLVFEKAKRMAEAGRDVFLLLDSITRTARAFNKWTNTGRTGTGGLDVKAMDIPKKMFGMARQFDEGGSLTVVGTALIETGGRMDDAIFQEFKGTGNMEMVLSRELAERRIWPAIDVGKSGTRRDEKLFTPAELEGVTRLRRSLISLSPVEAMEMLTKTLAKYPTNADFLAKICSIL